MISIQLIDLRVGLCYVSIGVVVSASSAGFMFTALLFLLLMFWIRPHSFMNIN